jgi:DNA polymerase (family 10)
MPVEALWSSGQLATIPGVGSTLAAKIDEFFTTGKIGAHERLQQEVPPGVLSMLSIPGVGPKRAALFWKSLGALTVDDLASAARDGRVAELPGFGSKSEATLLASLESLGRLTDRIPLGVALPVAYEILRALRQLPDVARAALVGSLRRRQETVRDLDFLAAVRAGHPLPGSAAARVLDGFCSLPQVSEVVSRGETQITARTSGGLPLDLRLIGADRWGTALQYFTGSEAHNLRLRAIGLQKGLSLSTAALGRDDGSEVLCATEEEVYRKLGMPTFPPEMREDSGEFKAAAGRALPRLLELSDLCGDLHVHTTGSDGVCSPLEMALAAKARGLSYALVADHTWSLGIVRGLTADQLSEQRCEIERVNARLSAEFRLLAGAEVEIRADGSLDLPDDVLSELDIVVASLHTGLRQSRERVTARVLAAIHNPHVDIIAHPTGRLIGERAPADLDMDKIFRAAAQAGTALEINSWPMRLDLRAEHVRRALELGVKFSVGSDAHNTDGFSDLAYGVFTARRGWATRADVVNAWSLDQLLQWSARPPVS